MSGGAVEAAVAEAAADHVRRAGMFGGCFGNVLGMCWDCFGYMLGDVLAVF